MERYNECYRLFADNDFTKKAVIKEFKRRFNCDFDIELYKDRIIVHTDLPLYFDVEYFGKLNTKKHIYAFLRYLANVSDFSFSLTFTDLDSLVL